VHLPVNASGMCGATSLAIGSADDDVARANRVRLNLHRWLDQVRNGDPGGFRTVAVYLQNEDHTATVMTWKLLQARIVKQTSGRLNAKGTDVAMEELTLEYERLELE
jgi:phage tail-like protein